MKNKFMKKFTALLLGTIMVLSLFPATLFTVNAAETASVVLKGTTGTLSSDKNTITWSGDGFTVVNTKGSTNIRNSDSDHYRAYKGSKISITASSGMIEKVIITALSGDYSANKIGTDVNAGTVTVDGTNYIVVFDDPVETFEVTLANQARLTNVEVVFAELGGNVCEHANTTAIGTPSEATCTEPGITAGEKCLDCGATLEAQETIPANGHDFVDGVCTVCHAETDIYELVTDVSTLKVGDKIIIVATGYNFALSTTQNGNNRGQVSVTISDNTIALIEGIQVLTLAEGNSSNTPGTYAFNTGSGYLYAASSSSNYLRTQATNNANSSWTISIDANGVATIKAQGDNTRNWLRYNSSSSIFSCYGSGQNDVSIYKLVEDTPDPVPAEAAELKTLGLTLNKGITVKVKLDISAEWFAANPDAKVEFSNGTECVVTGAGEQIFTTELTPAQFDDALTVTYGDLTGVVSVAKYKELVEEKDGTNTKLINLLDAIIKYGEVAGGATIEGNLDSVEDLDVEKKDQNLVIGIGATLEESATINLSFSGADVNKFVITKNDAPFAEGEITDGKLVLDKVFPNTYDDKFTLTVYNGDAEVATVTFSINAYLKALAAQEPSCKNLAVAVYQYGLATEAYLAK